MPSKNDADYILCNHPQKITVREVRELLSQKDDCSKQRLIVLIDHRLRGRYLHPIENLPASKKSGFLMMAVACLLIETLESFRLGIRDTNKVKGCCLFTNFFRRESSLFPGFSYPEMDFYKHIRCGILHQAETTGGYRIVRKGGLLTDGAINATEFVKALTTCLDAYLDDLKNKSLGDDIWVKAEKKILFICNNCCT